MKSLVLGCLLAACAATAAAPALAAAATTEIPYDPELSGQTVHCSDFRHDADGTWTTLHALPIQRMNEFATIAADTAFRAGGGNTVGLDVGAALDASCPH